MVFWTAQGRGYEGRGASESRHRSAPQETRREPVMGTFMQPSTLPFPPPASRLQIVDRSDAGKGVSPQGMRRPWLMGGPATDGQRGRGRPSPAVPQPAPGEPRALRPGVSPHRPCLAAPVTAGWQTMQHSRRLHSLFYLGTHSCACLPTYTGTHLLLWLMPASGTAT